MDALSDVLKTIRLEGAVYLNAEFTAPWCVQAKYGLGAIRKRLPGADHVAFFHYFVQGGCKVPRPGGAGELEVLEGDLLLFPHGDRQVQLMGTDLRLAPVDAGTVMDDAALAGGEVIALRHGGGGAPTRVICGYVGCSRSVSRPLFDALPPVLRIPVGEEPASAMLRELLRAGVRESSAARPGAASLLAKLSELMFVEALRRYVGSLPPGGHGWLAGVRDLHVGRALAAMHGDPARAWTVEELAREAALSRSALADRFAELVGEPPIQYLMRWRLALAAQSLRSGAETIARVAERSGYESVAAFTRAFKREFGVPPAAWRDAVPGVEAAAKAVSRAPRRSAR
jgi:AraC family transcriptional regulator, alkane utilization regulator